MYKAFSTSDASGFFDLGGLTADTYVVEVAGNSNVVISEYYEDRTSASNATPIVVGEDATAGPLSLSVALAGSISGVVADDAGNPIESARVEAHDVAAGYVRSASTDVDGRFTILQLHQGVFELYTSAANGPYLAEWYEDVQQRSEATSVGLGQGEDLSGFEFRLAPGASISGGITDDSGQAITYTPVQLYAAEAPTTTLATVYSDLDGRYYFGGLSAGSYLVRYVGNATYAGEWFDDALSVETATRIEVGLGENAVDVDAVLADSFIAGTVIDGSGTPIAGVRLTLYNSTGSAQRSATSDDAGRFKFGASTLPAGDYAIYAVDQSGRFRSGWYGGAWVPTYDPSFTFAQAQVLSFSPPSQLDADFELVERGRVSGVVSDLNGDPIAGIKVRAMNISSYNWDAEATTAEDGSYSIGLNGGDYWIFFESTEFQYVSEYYDDRDQYCKCNGALG